MRKIILFLCIYFCHSFFTYDALSQPIYNDKNIDRDLITEFYDDLKKVRLLEYSTDPAGNNLERRLEMKPEMGMPGIQVRILNDKFEEFYLIDQPPFDDIFDNGFYDLKHSIDGATLLFGTEVALKIIKDKFGWTGLDNQQINGQPIIWNIMKNPSPLIAAPAYGYLTNEFYYYSNSQEPEKLIGIDGIGHEIMHGIYNAKISTAFPDPDPCSELNSIKEAISDIIGLYIKNEYEQNSPAFYSWTIQKGQIFYPGRNFADPNSHQKPDTYYGNFFANMCPFDPALYYEHRNATVIDHWYYLLSEGTLGSESNDLGYQYDFDGIGVNKAVQIVWKSVDFLNKQSTFAGMKEATLKAAEQLYGLHSLEYLATKNAWCAAGVCDNNLVSFSLTPANGAQEVQPWPAVNVSFSWLDKPVTEWEVQFSTKFDFSENLKTAKVNSFSTFINPAGGVTYSGTALGYYHPGETVYARARITQADPNFCKGFNPLCALYQQFGPTHAFVLDDKKAEFWNWLSGPNKINPWKDPALTWKSVNGAHKYTFQLSSDKTFSTQVFTGATTHTGNYTESGLINAPLEIGKIYYTRVRAERLNSLSIVNNFGAWSDTDSVYVSPPPTEVLQAKTQKAADPATVVSSMGFWIGWEPVPGAGSFVVQIATDDSFSNVIRQQIAAPDLTTVEVLLPVLATQTNLFARVLPEKGGVYSTCLNTWRIKTDENATKPAMKSPVNGFSIPFKNYLGTTFEWNGNTLNTNLVDHFELHLKEKSSGTTTIFNTGAKKFDFFVKDQLMFDDKQGLEAKVRAVGPLGAKSGFSAPFNYTICPDNPAVTFPGDLGKIDPSKAFNITWDHSLWFDAGSQYLVTIKEGQNPVAGFNNTAVMGNSINVPAGKLGGNKTFELTVKNSSACAGIALPSTIFFTTNVGNNQPQPPVLKNFTIELHAFRNDADPNFLPPAFETSDYVLGVELFDPNGVKVPVVDGNGNPVTQLLVDSENAVLAMAATMKPVGKYTLKLKMINIFNQLEYFPFDQPRFSVFLSGQSVVDNHIITFNPLDPASPFNEWQNNFQFADIVLDVK